MATEASETALPARPAGILHYWPGLPLLAGAALLIVAEFLTLYEIRTVTVVPPGGTETAGAHHSYALVLIGLALIPMTVGAVRGGSRPAAIAALVLALAALGIALLVDLPDVNETGLIGREYDAAQARPQAGFYLETLGAVLALVGAATALLVRRR